MPLSNLARYEYDAVLRDGRTVRIRPIRPDDLDAMMEWWSRLSRETIRMRFFAPRSMTREQMRYFTEVDFDSRFAVVAESAGRILGVSRFDRLDEDPTAAEFAVVVEDAEQGRGIGTQLLRALLPPADELGVKSFTGDVLRENDRMLAVMREAGLEPAYDADGNVVTARFGATPTEEFLASSDEQDRQAAVAALTSIVKPTSIAVVGASRKPTSIGGLVFRNLLDGHFTGAVYPVNSSAPHVQSVAAYPSLAACPTVPDMVLVCVPAPLVADTVEEAGRLGSKAIVIISAGFSEVGEEGAAEEKRVMGIARAYGARVVGPNCMGVLNASEAVRMNGTFSQVFPDPGRISFSSQSGALGLSILSATQNRGLGISSFASIGNKADISGNDLLQYWESDPDTEVILLYLESFGNPRKFGRIARRIGRQKPIVAVKSGRTSAGVRAASSHTGALAAGDVAVDALFRQAGVIRVDTLEQLFGTASVLADQPAPRGNRVAILSNGGGPGILAADACESNGLEVPELAPQTLEALGEFLPAEAGIRNPVDMVASATAEDYGHALRVLAEDPHVDAVMVIFIPPIVTRANDVARELQVAQRDHLDPQIPVLGVFMSEGGTPQELLDARIPDFDFPEDAAAALGRIAQYGAWRRRPLGNVVDIHDADVPAARAVVDEALGGTRDEAWLDAWQADRLLRAFGIETAPARVVHDPEEAAEAQRQLGGEVAAKVAAPVHKSDIGGVKLGLTTPEATAEAVRAMHAELVQAKREEIAAQGFLIQRMVGSGVEMVVGVSHDKTFGPILMAGMGGTLVELLRDVSVRIHPLTDTDVEEMLTSLRGYPLLTGYRGGEAVDVDAFRTLLFRMSALVEEVPEIDDVDLNPVFVHRKGIAAVDARIKLAAEHPRPRR
ncbi:GNAT family N-acetyltransferase [Egibacter rhizosphaerae]|uniref:GNAT family N-acetyltransferase n=1 Tax=Egibacter rhizosphaerae TaxID=1670831 RepID=A0A411YDX1_9ACTN|nr:GNAT family N-acetyltransferase [Egibacter rhizosphaerae]QBI19434.1 GNAT family N-acetyltransferase [Egibacter rhizosphaerae]